MPATVAKKNTRAKTNAQQTTEFVDHESLHGPGRARKLIERAAELMNQSSKLSREEELELFMGMHAIGYVLSLSPSRRPRMKFGGRKLQQLRERIANRIVNRNVGLVYTMLRYCKVDSIDEGDLISGGFWALFRAAMAFDPWRGFRFSTYASNAILRRFQYEGKRAARRKSVVQNYADAEGMAAANASTPERNDRDMEFLKDRLRTALHHNDAELTPTERYVIQRRFLELERGRPETLQSIGEIIQLSKERVRQIQLRALYKLRTVLAEDQAVAKAMLAD